MIHPRDMERVSITGPKSQLDSTIRRLHELNVLDIDDYNGEYDEFELGNPEKHADGISNTLVAARSLLDRLPDVESDGPAEIDGLNDLQERVDTIEDELEMIEDERQELEERRDRKEELLARLRLIDRLGLDPDDFQQLDAVDIILGRVDDTSFEDELPEGRYELYQDGDAIALFVDADLDVDQALGRCGFDPVEIDDLYEVDKKARDAIRDVKEKLDDIRSDIDAIDDEKKQLAEKHRSYLEANEKELAEELEKAEAPLRFATSENAFVAEGWMPEDRFKKVKTALEDESDGRVHVQREDADGEQPPVQHDNPGPVDNFEDLTDLVSVPKYGEVDPSFILFLTFPLFFGFMIGDAGYGLASFIVFYLGMRMFPGAKDIFKSLMFASAATFVFGLIFGDAFGYIIFGEHSALTALTGIEFFSQIPVLFHRTHNMTMLFMISAAIGVVHINLGYLLGMYNEYRHHGLIEAVLAKGSWIVLELGAVAWYLYGTAVGAPVMVTAVAMLAKGEGIQGIVEIPSLLSNILSYLRIFGVMVAAIALAKVVNSLASPMLATGTLLGLSGGTLILMVGHTMNTFIKIIEGFLQGIRLHYVEMFMKFFDGGGRPYNPFGARFADESRP
ncbi:MAG: V-type ATP synthase subunit I [Candidatus Nanohaloarchaea archaeon]|nr:V-type ATP synthase subunit I [Candidatus Nanohaloarchaea archaeon]